MSIKTRYDAIAISLHWLTALAILAMLVMGWTMTSLKPGSLLQFSLYQWHKSVGMTVLALTVLRLLWRLGHHAPALPDAMPPLEKLGAHLGHLGLYGLLFGLPLSGWAVVSTSPFNIPTVLYGVLPLPHLTFLADLADKGWLNKQLQGLHELGVWFLLLLLAVHVGAALRHHFLIKDTVLVRMLPRFGVKESV